MTKPWVGFQSSPKPIAGSKRQVVELSISSALDIASVFSLFTSAEGISEWLGQTEKCKPFVGEKFSSELAGEAVESVFISISVPTRVVILNDFLGEIDIKLKAKAEQVSCVVRVVRATTADQLSPWRTEIEQTFSKLKSAVNHG